MAAWWTWPHPTVPPPNPDTSQFEPLVARRIAERRAAVEADPRDAESWGRLGMSFDVHNLVAEAVACYTQAERLDPHDFRWPYHRAICMPDAPPDEIIAALEKAVALRPDFAPCLVRLGHQCLKAGRTDDSRAHFERALTIDPRNTHAQVGLAEIALQAGDHNVARERLERALRDRPDHGEAQRMLARVYHALGMADQAGRLAGSAARLPSKTPLPDPARTEVVFEGATAKLLVRQASRLRQDNRPHDAIAKLRLALQTAPDDADAHLQLGLALFFDLGRRSDGLLELREAVRLAPNHPHARRALDAATQQSNDPRSKPRP